MVYATTKVTWATGRKQDTFDFLRNFCSTLASDVGGGGDDISKSPQLQENRHLLARAYLKQGQWQQELTPTWTPDIIEEIVNCYQMATEFDPTWSKAWHSWALCNFEAINHLEALDGDSVNQHEDLLVQYTLAAIKGMASRSFHSSADHFAGFFRSIALRSDNPLQDSLRVLTLWFKFGADERITLAVSEGASLVSVDTWLDVVPQVIPQDLLRTH